MRIAVVGAAGALGYSIVAETVRRGLEVVAVARRARPGLLPEGATVVQADAGDAEGLARAIGEAEALFYCVNVPLRTWASQLVPLCRSAIHAANQLGARFVFPANVWIYGKGTSGETIDESRPPSPSSKKGRLRTEQERLVKETARRWSMVRLPEFYGPNVANRLMGAPFQDALAGKPLTWMGGDLDVRVEFVFMPDGARAMVEVGTAQDTERQIFHVPGSAPTTPREFLETIARSAGIRPKLRSFPRWLLRTVALAYPPAREFTDILHLWTDPVLLDGSLYRQRFGAVPATPYERGVEETLAWFRRHPDAVNAN